MERRETRSKAKADETKTDDDDINWDYLDRTVPACEDIAALAYIVCLTGPVDIHSPNPWPSALKGGFSNCPGVNGGFSIADKFREAKYPKPITNTAWKKFCMVVSQGIDCSLDCVRESFAFKKYGKLWPSCNAEFVKDGLFQMIKKIEIRHYSSVHDNDEETSAGESDAEEDAEEDAKTNARDSDAEKDAKTNAGNSLIHSDESKAEYDEIDWDHLDWTVPACEDIAALAYIVCLTGPVDIHSPNPWTYLKGGFTNWPVMKGGFSIADKFKEAKYPKPITNAAWKEFCMVVSQGIDCSLDCVRESFAFEKYGKLWPSCNAEFEKEGLFQVVKEIERRHYSSFHVDDEEYDEETASTKDSDEDEDENSESDSDRFVWFFVK